MPNSTRDKLATLTETLIDRTKKKQILWEISADDGVYQSKLGKHIVQIYVSYKADASIPDYNISLINEDGQLLDRFSDPDLAGFKPSKYDGFFSAMGDLYAMAGSQATGADNAIDDILSFLTEPKAF